MAITKLYAQIEFADGREEDVRVLLADKLKYEHTARIHKWEADANTLTGQLFLAWAAAKRSGLTDSEFELFKSEVVDFFMTNDDPEGNEVETPTSESINV